ncbi:MAG TPA: penicillin-binding transpeptidase domain-containing protein [Gemmatimonadales bacterium]|jgi:cell division protein FtsI (penicillin-binding protein 3)
MAKPAARIIFLEVLLALGGAGILARSFLLQVVQHDVWEKKLKQQREGDDAIPARRGQIYDRNGELLATSQEQYHVTIALNEVRDTAALAATVEHALGVPHARVAAEFQNDYPYFNGPFTAEQVRQLDSARGVYLKVLYQRVYPVQSVADHILGRLDDGGVRGIEGIEKSLDTLLRGRPGREHYVLDAKGTRLAAPGPPLLEPVAGHDVFLTIDNGLQGVAEGVLRDAVIDDDARGGDLVILDVRSGEFLAVASVRIDSVTHKLKSTSSALVEPNEPGSTSKLFTVAGLLRTGADTTPVDGEGGHWMMPIGRAKPRRIDDVDRLTGPVTLGETVKYSSNIAISKFSLRLRPEQQYEAIRDFGFGTSPGMGFPGEAPGKLQRPALWVNHLLTQPSLGQGYEWEASAAQLAVGYGAIANHGVLMAPTLVREVRDEHGAVTWRHQPDTVRRAVPDSIARILMTYLKAVTDSGGTGTKARLDAYKVAGKTGTAKVKSGGYRASFVGIFSADNPQAVLYVMIDRPSKGKFYGGDVAAPIVPAVMKQALALQRSPFDRSSLTTTVEVAPAARPPVRAFTAIHRVALPLVPPRPITAHAEVPATAGREVREAVVTLERAGFAVRLVGRSRVRASAPAAGDSLPRGATVTLYADSLP